MVRCGFGGRPLETSVAPCSPAGISPSRSAAFCFRGARILACRVAIRGDVDPRSPVCGPRSRRAACSAHLACEPRGAGIGGRFAQTRGCSAPEDFEVHQPDGPGRDSHERLWSAVKRWLPAVPLSGLGRKNQLAEGVEFLHVRHVDRDQLCFGNTQLGGSHDPPAMSPESHRPG